jgi:GT2 family glycosyltransferase
MLHLVVPLWNQWPMTEAFLQSLEAAEPRGSYRLILVDNGSRDATAGALQAWKKRLPFQLIRNRRNLGVAPAWNQGLRAALRAKATWVGVLNNDLLLSAGALTRLRQRAADRGWSLASPATREGALDYDLAAYAAAYTRRCFRWDQAGRWFGWCFLVQRQVFQRVGLFDEGYELGIGEDEDFFRRARAAGLACGVTGASFVHHFGSATLGPWRREHGKAQELRNMERLRQKHGLVPRSAFARRRAQWGDTVGRAWARARWGHQLKE